MKNIKTIQGIKKTQRDYQFLNFRIKGLPTLGVGSMQVLFFIGCRCITMLVHPKAQCFYFNGSH
jgi:hypothetical protein